MAAQPCDDAIAQQGWARVEAERAQRPWRMGSPPADPERLGWIVAGESIVAACPGLPGRGMLVEDIDMQDVDPWREAIRRTCPAWDTVLMNTQPREGASWRANADEAFATCDLGRFELADPLRYGLGGRDIDAFVTYDHMLRQGADPELAAELSRALMWQGAWEITDEVAGRLPSARSGIGRPAGEIGVRVTLGGYDVRSGVGELSLAEAVAHVEPWLSSRAADAEPATVLVVADADVAITDVVAIANALGDRGASNVSVLVSDPRGRVGAVGIRGEPAERWLRATAVCIDASQVHVEWPDAWRPAAALHEVLDGGETRIGSVFVTAGTSLERVLDVLGVLEAELVHGAELVPERILDVPDVGTCAAWLQETAAADADAKALADAWARCEQMRRRKPRARCMREACERAREHVAAFPNTLDVDHRRHLADLRCLAAGASTKRRVRRE